MRLSTQHAVPGLLSLGLIICISACGGAVQKGALDQASNFDTNALERNFAVEEAVESGFGLPSPSEALRNASDCGHGRILSAGPLSEDPGAQPNNRVGEVGEGGAMLQFFPDYDASPNDDLNDTAYVFHFFEFDEVPADSIIHYDWTNPPSDPANLWLAIANWSTDRFELVRATDSTSDIFTGITDFTDYMAPGSNTFLLVTLVLGIDSCVLREIQIGPDPEPIVDVEPNDTFTIAMEVEVDELGCLIGKVGTSATDTEDDYFQFEVTETGDLSVSLAYDSPGNNVDLYLYNRDQEELVASANLTGNETVSYRLLDLGTYWLQVRRQSGSLGQTVDYTMESEWLPKTFVFDEHEPNNNLLDPEIIPALPLEGFRCRLGGEQSVGNDFADFFLVNVPVPGLLDIEMLFKHSQANLDLQLSGPSGLPIFAVSNSTDDNEEISFQINETGEYLIYCRYNHPPTSPFIADYILNVGFTPGGGYTEIEPNNSIEEAQIVSLPVVDFIGGLGNFGEDGGDEDFLRFTVGVSGLLNVTLEHDALLANIDLAVMTLDGQILLGSSLPGGSEEVELVLPSEGTYYIYAVRNLVGGLGSDYTLNATFVPGPACNGGSEEEPNDGAGSFNELPPLDICDFTGVLGGTEGDYNGFDEFRFELGYPGDVEILLSFTHALNDLDLWLYKGEERLNVGQGESSDDDETTSVHLDEPGVYRVICISKAVNDFAPYLLDIDFTADSPDV